MQAGTRLHLACLEPELFTQCYAVAPKFDMRTNVGKADSAAWQEANPNRTAISGDEYSQSMFIADILHANATVRELLRGGHNERSIFANDPETGVLTKCRPDSDTVISGRRVLADQMEYLLTHFPRSSPLHARLRDALAVVHARPA